jgi:hypothetical protein
MSYVKISQLPIGLPNSTSIFPFVDSGTTYHGAISAITVSLSAGTSISITGTYPDFTISYTGLSGGLIEVTYSELVDKITGETLNEGSYYIITDFQTCYDVPEYYVNGNPKGIGEIDYRQSNVEPIIVLATSINTISSTAYQPAYPNDRIQYDWTFNLTPNTGGVAYGRITERIDEFNNRTDYDHRTIFFNRFKSYNKGSQLTGTINSYDSATGIITGNGTLFLSEVEIGDILFFEYQGYTVGVKVYSASSNTLIYVIVDPSFGSTINFTGGLIPFYSSTLTSNYYEYKEVYIGQKNEEDWNDYLTFNLDGSAIHNYIGDYSRFYIDEIGTNSGFLLANNVFYGNKTYSNTIGDRSYNNTGTYWFSRNTISGRFYNNVIHNNGFYSNSIGEYFDNNIIKGYMWENKINQYFEDNEINQNFYGNQIGNYFNNNINYHYFNDNIISNDFNNNTIGQEGTYYEFYNNKIDKDFKGNLFLGDFSLNTVDSNVYSNQFSGYTTSNKIGVETHNNDFLSGVTGNVLQGNFYENTIDGLFDGNTIGFTFHNNTITGALQGNKFGYETYDNIIIDDFTGNTIGNNFYNNEFSGGTIENIIGNLCYENIILNFFEGNNISYSFKGNLILEPFAFNNVGLGFTANQISGQTIFNTFGDVTAGNDFLGNFISNKISNLFVENSVGNDFSLNTIGESFGFNIIGNSFGANTIGIGFQENTIGNEFESNIIGDIFSGNTIGDSFGYGAVSSQKNIIGDNFINNIIGEHFYNNRISNNFNFNIVDNYFQWNIVDTLVFDTCLTSPVLYEPVTVNVFKNRNLDDRLSYYDELDVLTIETLTEAPCNDISALDIPENDLNFGLIL